jgi:hypothetical protein
MNTLEIPVKKIFVTYPSEWEEMDRDQSIFVGELLYKMHKKQLDVDQFRKLVLDRFIRRVNNIARHLTEDEELDLWGNEWLLAETMNFFFKITVKDDKVKKKNNKKAEKDGDEAIEEKQAEQWEIMPRFTKNLIPWFRIGFGRKLYGPGDFMQGMTFSEYKDALSASMKYMETSEDVWLDRLTAILYRRKRPGLRRLRHSPDFDGRMRIAYNQERVERDSMVMKRVTPGIKYMALMYISGCLWALKSDADGNGIEIDGTRFDFSLLFKRGNKDENPQDSVGMIGVMMALAESGVFGNLKDVANTDVWDVLVRMYQLELDRREFDRRMEKHK